LVVKFKKGATMLQVGRLIPSLEASGSDFVKCALVLLLIET